MSGSKPRLTPQQAIELREAAKTGVTCRELAQRYGIGRTAVRNYLRGQIQAPEIVAVSPRPVYLAAGRRPKLSYAQAVLLRAMASEGVRRADIARQFGLSPSGVKKYLGFRQKSRLLAA